MNMAIRRLTSRMFPMRRYTAVRNGTNGEYMGHGLPSFMTLLLPVQSSVRPVRIIENTNLKSDCNRKPISGAKMRFTKNHDYECFQT